MKNYDEIIDKTICARCLEIKREQFPNTRCPWRSIDNEYCEKAQELADYIQELKERCSKSSYRDSWKNKFFKAQEEIETQRKIIEYQDSLQDELAMLKEERENMNDEIFALENMLHQERIEKMRLREAIEEAEKRLKELQNG